MAKVSATASMGVKMKWWSDYENISPHASVTIEKELEEGQDPIEEAEKLYDRARHLVESKIGDDVKTAKRALPNKS